MNALAGLAAIGTALAISKGRSGFGNVRDIDTGAASDMALEFSNGAANHMEDAIFMYRRGNEKASLRSLRKMKDDLENAKFWEGVAKGRGASVEPDYSAVDDAFERYIDLLSVRLDRGPDPVKAIRRRAMRVIPGGKK